MAHVPPLDMFHVSGASPIGATAQGAPSAVLAGLKQLWACLCLSNFRRFQLPACTCGHVKGAVGLRPKTPSPAHVPR
eukprot:13444801-Alexandrium_andersonii.AAC.1